MAKKENALDLAKLIDKGVRVKLSGGREGETLSLSSMLCHVTRNISVLLSNQRMSHSISSYTDIHTLACSGGRPQRL